MSSPPAKSGIAIHRSLLRELFSYTKSNSIHRSPHCGFILDEIFTAFRTNLHLALLKSDFFWLALESRETQIPKRKSDNENQKAAGVEYRPSANLPYEMGCLMQSLQYGLLTFRNLNSQVFGGKVLRE